jgi:hypothetical protein
VRRHARRRVAAAQGHDIAGSGQAAFHRSQTATLPSYADSIRQRQSRRGRGAARPLVQESAYA